MKKKILYGLQVEDYIHPIESNSFIQVEQSGLIAVAMDKFSELATEICNQIVLGRYVELSEELCPRVITILNEVCMILDYQKPVRVFVTHEYDNSCIQLGSDVGYILLTDRIINEASDEMLYFALGNSIGMFKGGHIRLATLNAALTYIPELMPVRIALQSKQRAADLSSDRAGLLACQNYAGAVRYILWELGLPQSELQIMPDSAVCRIAKRYSEDLRYLRKSVLSEGFSEWKKWNGTTSPAAFRLEEITKWYESDYKRIITGV